MSKEIVKEIITKSGVFSDSHYNRRSANGCESNSRQQKMVGIHWAGGKKQKSMKMKMTKKYERKRKPKGGREKKRLKKRRKQKEKGRNRRAGA